MTLFPPELLDNARAVAAQLSARAATIATAESCTGGLVSALLTELPGSSKFFTHGFVTYANEAKASMLGVEATLIVRHGAVSEPVARAMAEGALRKANSSYAISITGIAGPGGGTPEKPVGTVHMALAVRGGATIHSKHQFTGDRAEIRMKAVAAALEMVSVHSAA